jgi:hypothetical protein
MMIFDMMRAEQLEHERWGLRQGQRPALPVTVRPPAPKLPITISLVHLFALVGYPALLLVGRGR